MKGKPKVSQVCEELIDFIQSQKDPLVSFDKKSKATSEYRKKNRIQ